MHRAGSLAAALVRNAVLIEVTDRTGRDSTAAFVNHRATARQQQHNANHESEVFHLFIEERNSEFDFVTGGPFRFFPTM